MGTLGRHKRRRRNTHEHVCRNETGQIGGEDPSLQQDGDSSSLANATANQPQEQEGTQMPDCAGRERSFSAPQKYPNKKSTNTDPPVGTSTVQKKCWPNVQKPRFSVSWLFFSVGMARQLNLQKQ